MDLYEAIHLVTKHTQEEANPEQTWSPATAIPFVRAEVGEADVMGGVSDPTVAAAYYMVLDAPEHEISAALAYA